MSKPSNILLQRQKSKKLMIFPHHHHNNYNDEHYLTRQFSNMSSSNEGYHGGEIASVPFEWESQPGTPKVRFKENSLPPLTPPPSYYQKNVTKKPTFNAKKNSSSSSPKSSLLKAIFPKRATRDKECVFQPPKSPNSLSYSFSSSSSSSSSPQPRISYSVPSSPMVHSRKGREEEDLYDVPHLSLCFGNERSRGFCSSMFKKVLLGEFM